MKNDNAWITGAAFSVVVALGYLICAVAVIVAPDATLAVLNGWAHGIDLSLIKRPPSQTIRLTGWVSGVSTIIVTAFMAGTIFGWARNFFRRIADSTA